MKTPNFEKQNTEGFNMTPIIDVVFLLIIFFMLVCQFIVAENYDVTVPDEITSAHDERDEQKLTTVTVMRDDNGLIAYAVGSERFDSNANELAEQIAREIDERLTDENQTVSLRIDKDIDYRHSQYALAGISKSSATKIKMAVTK
jgi:biopolymer transport protein ExbD